jgi:hypothetical protein
MPRWIIPVVLLAGAAAACDTLYKTCTLRGCASGVTFHADLPVSFDELKQSQLEVCRNDQCLSGGFADLPMPSDSVGQSVELRPADGNLDPNISPRASATVWIQSAGAGRIQIQWFSFRLSDLKDGDQYRVTLKDQAGSARLSIDQKIDRYLELYPNGKDCDDEPCRTAVIDRRAGK